MKHVGFRAGAAALKSDVPPFISVDQASEFLGLSRSAGYRAASTGYLPVVRWGRRMYVPTARLLALVQEINGEAGP